MLSKVDDEAEMTRTMGASREVGEKGTDAPTSSSYGLTARNMPCKGEEGGWEGVVTRAGGGGGRVETGNGESKTRGGGKEGRDRGLR